MGVGFKPTTTAGISIITPLLQYKLYQLSYPIKNKFVAKMRHSSRVTKNATKNLTIFYINSFIKLILIII